MYQVLYEPMSFANEVASGSGHHRIPTETIERYRLVCRRCGHRWTSHYFVRRRPRGGGRVAELFYQHDTLVPSPWSFAECPQCDASWVRVVSVKARPAIGERAGDVPAR